MRLLIVDDDKTLNDELRNELINVGFDVYSCYDGVDALAYLESNQCDIVLMDVDMPNLDGISTLKKIKENTNLPVIITSERTSKMDVIFAYESGCIDYIRKPYYNEEIIWKIKNWTNQKSTKQLRYGAIELDLQGRSVYVDGKEKSVTQKEYQLLKYLTEHNGVAIEREKLLNDVWGYGFFGDDRTIDTHIKMLRNTLGNHKDYIQTIRGYGYKFEVK